MEPTKGVRLRESASRDVAGDLWLVILEEALEHHSPCEKKMFLVQEMTRARGKMKKKSV